MRKGELNRLFFVAFAIPYLVLLLMGGGFLYRTLSALEELRNLGKIAAPLSDLSSLIIYLNAEKVYKVFELTNPVAYYDYLKRENKELLNQLKKLKEDLLKDKTWTKYCECKEVLNFEKVSYELENAKNTGLKELLSKFDNVINKYCYYYIQLTKSLRLKGLSLEFKSLYTLHKFNTVVSDFAAETLYYIKFKNPNYIYAGYYYRGELYSYADVFYAFSDIESLRKNFKNRIYNSPFLQRLLSNYYTNTYEVLNDYTSYKESFAEFHKEEIETLLSFIEKEQEKLKNRIWEVVFLTVLGLLSLLVLNFVLYQYGQAKFTKFVLSLEEKALKDPLTGLYNRRFFNLYIAELLRRRRENPEEIEPLSFILLDLDDFKRINDTYGHQFGDKVLKHVAKIIRQNLRREDIAVRWGGEEFAIIAKAPLNAAVKLAERIRRAIESNPVNGVKLTASFGVGELTGRNPKEVFKKVDEALYRAKRSGKNRVEVAY